MDDAEHDDRGDYDDGCREPGQSAPALGVGHRTGLSSVESQYSSSCRVRRRTAGFAFGFVHELSRTDALRVAVRAQLLDAYRPTSLLDVVRGLTLWQQHKSKWIDANDAFRRDLLARLDDAGPLPAADLPDTCTTPWRSTGWNNNRNVGQMLEIMEERGEIAVAGRRGASGCGTLPSACTRTTRSSRRTRHLLTRNQLRLHALGIARSRGPECRVEPDDVDIAGEPAVIDGVRGEWRVDPAHLDATFEGRTAVVSPPDRVIYDRKRMTDIFDFDYQLEKAGVLRVDAVDVR